MPRHNSKTHCEWCMRVRWSLPAEVGKPHARRLGWRRIGLGKLLLFQPAPSRKWSRLPSNCWVSRNGCANANPLAVDPRHRRTDGTNAAGRDRDSSPVLRSREADQLCRAGPAGAAEFHYGPARRHSRNMVRRGCARRSWNLRRSPSGGPTSFERSFAG